MRNSDIDSEATFSISGGYANLSSGTTSASRNHVFICSGSESPMSVSVADSKSAKIYGGALYASSGYVQADNNMIHIVNTKFNGNSGVYSGYIWGNTTEETIRANSNQTIIENSSFSSASINGALVSTKLKAAETQSNIVQISGSSFGTLQAIGAWTPSGQAVDNRVMISDSMITDSQSMNLIVGARSENDGNASNNIVSVDNSIIAEGSLIFGGYVRAGTAGIASDNHVVIGNNVTGIGGGKLVTSQVFGGIVNGSGFINGNTLTAASSFDTQALSGFQHYNFIIDQNRLNQGALISVTGDMPVVLRTGADNTSSIALESEEKIAAGKYTLIDSKAGFTDLVGNILDENTDLSGLKTDLDLKSAPSVIRTRTNTISADDYELSIEDSDLNKALVTTFTEPIDEDNSSDSINPETDSLVKSALSVYSTLFAADDLIIDTAVKSRDGVHDGLFVAARGGNLEYDDSIDTDIFTGIVGYSVTKGDFNCGPFFEMGRANYRADTYVDGRKLHSSGNHTFGGVGLYGNWQTPYLVNLSAYVKAGMLKNSFDGELASQQVEYTRARPYWGAHLGASLDVDLNSLLSVRPYVSYFYDGREGDRHSVSGSGTSEGGIIRYDDLNSHRIQAGSEFAFNINANWHPYVGLAYENILKAEASGTAKDTDGVLDLNDTDMEGGSGIYSVGVSYLNDAQDVELNLGVNGYSGVREGITGQIYANWRF